MKVSVATEAVVDACYSQSHTHRNKTATNKTQRNNTADQSEAAFQPTKTEKSEETDYGKPNHGPGYPPHEQYP